MLKKIFGKRDSNFIGFDKYKKKGAYHWQEIEKNVEYRSLIQVVEKYLKPTHEVLDIGCGDGAYLGFISGKIKSGEGVDADKTAAQLASEMFRKKSINNCTAQNLTIKEARAHFMQNSKKFDIIWSMDVIEHLPDPNELIDTMLDLLKENGSALIGTPLFITEELKSPYHVKEFSRSEISGMLTKRAILVDEIVLPHTRKDKTTYTEGYYIGLIKKNN